MQEHSPKAYIPVGQLSEKQALHFAKPLLEYLMRFDSDVYKPFLSTYEFDNRRVLDIRASYSPNPIFSLTVSRRGAGQWISANYEGLFPKETLDSVIEALRDDMPLSRSFDEVLDKKK
jgi:hypothetical protein